MGVMQSAPARQREVRMKTRMARKEEGDGRCRSKKMMVVRRSEALPGGSVAWARRSWREGEDEDEDERVSVGNGNGNGKESTDDANRLLPGERQ